MIIEWTSIILIILLLSIDLAIIKLIEKKTKINGEMKRKTFHITMGISMLTLPYIFTSIYSVAILAILAIVILIILKYTKLKNGIGTVIYSVDRESWGEIFFVISVLVIFYLSKGDKILYSVPILILTLADSVAALIGKNYGKKDISYMNEDSKSIEGSFMFFMTAFIITLVPLLLYTNIGREETLIISAIIGFNVSLMEMVSHSGNDNLLIPLTTYALLITHINLEVQSLRINLIILATIFILVTIANKVKSFSKLTLVEAFVVGYLTVTLYGIYGIFPPLMLFLTCLRFPKLRENEKNNLYDARIIETNVLVGIIIAGLATITGEKSKFFITYSLAYSMHLSINTFVRLKYYFNLTETKSLIYAFSKGLIFIFVPSIIIQKIIFKESIQIITIVLSIIMLLISCIAIMIAKKEVEQEEISIKNGLIHMKIVAVLIGIMTIAQFYNLI